MIFLDEGLHRCKLYLPPALHHYVREETPDKERGSGRECIISPMNEDSTSWAYVDFLPWPQAAVEWADKEFRLHPDADKFDREARC